MSLFRKATIPNNSGTRSPITQYDSYGEYLKATRRKELKQEVVHRISTESFEEFMQRVSCRADKIEHYGTLKGVSYPTESMSVITYKSEYSYIPEYGAPIDIPDCMDL